MRFSESICLKAEDILRNRAMRAEKLADERKKAVMKKYPELKKIDSDIKNAALELLSGVANGKSVDVSLLSKKSLSAQAERRRILADAGLPEDYLDPRYECPDCRDTGYCDGRICACHLELLKKLSMSELPCAGLLAVSSFDTFDLGYYGKTKDPDLGYSPYEYMKGASGMLKSYAASFPDGKKNMLFCGSTGLGKTHLALAVMNVITDNGHSVFYDSASSIIKELEREQYGKSNGDILAELLENDLVIIDDLGREYKTNFTEYAVYETVNKLLMSGIPLIICTDLTVAQMEEKYGQRIASRLNSFEIINFCGEDIRQQKK